MDVETHIKSKSKVGAWIGAMRLRTLPLAIASTILGSTIAEMGGKFDWSIALLTGLTTILLQINSNLANDYGDFEKGTDDESRIGPMRAMQSGDISEPEMKRAIMLFSALSFIAGLALIWIADLILVEKVIFLIAGIAAIFASIRYTAGSNPYGYRGLGDLSVLFFFGILGVYGAFYIQVGVLQIDPWLCALAMDCFSAGVLNVNNIRDLGSDQAAGKITLAVRMGERLARKYHVLLLLVGLGSVTLFGWLNFSVGIHWLPLLAFPLIGYNAWKVYTTNEAARLDPYLKQLALSTFVLTILFAAGQAL